MQDEHIYLYIILLPSFFTLNPAALCSWLCTLSLPAVLPFVGSILEMLLLWQCLWVSYLFSSLIFCTYVNLSTIFCKRVMDFQQFHVKFGNIKHVITYEVSWLGHLCFFFFKRISRLIWLLRWNNWFNYEQVFEYTNLINYFVWRSVCLMSWYNFWLNHIRIRNRFIYK